METQPKRELADKPPTRGGAVDHRTRRGHRRRELIAIYSGALGGEAKLSDGQRVDVRKAAELVALAEDARALAMQWGPGNPGALSAMVRLQSASERAVRMLGLPAPGRAAAPVSTLQDFISEEGG